MWHIGINRIVLALAVGIGLLIATASESEVASLDPYHPATLLPLVSNRVDTVTSYVRNFSARELMVAAGLRERIPPESAPQSE